jgi:hypothetical protein
MARLQWFEWSNEVNSTLPPSATAVLMLTGLSPPTDGQSPSGFRSDIINPFCDVTTNCFSLINALVVTITLPTIGGRGITSIVQTPFL